MIASTVTLKFASFLILPNKVTSLPLLAHLKRIILEQVGLPPKVLPVVSVDALRLIVLSVIRAPLSFKVEHVELLIASHLMN